MASVMGVPTPTPTWVPFPSVSDIKSSNDTMLALYPVVLRFARLLPTTSIAVEEASRAERAVEKDVSMRSPDQEFVVVPVLGGVVDWVVPVEEAGGVVRL